MRGVILRGEGEEGQDFCPPRTWPISKKSPLLPGYSSSDGLWGPDGPDFIDM